jgi:hypothetical protein
MNNNRWFAIVYIQAIRDTHRSIYENKGVAIFFWKQEKCNRVHHQVAPYGNSHVV